MIKYTTIFLLFEGGRTPTEKSLRQLSFELATRFPYAVWFPTAESLCVEIGENPLDPEGQVVFVHNIIRFFSEESPTGDGLGLANILDYLFVKLGSVCTVAYGIEGNDVFTAIEEGDVQKMRQAAYSVPIAYIADEDHDCPRCLRKLQKSNLTCVACHNSYEIGSEGKCILLVK